MIEGSFIDLIKAAVDSLERAGIEYAITGSVATAVHGEPITTHDVDIIVRMSPAQASQLDAELPQRFYRSSERLRDVATRGGLANLIDAETGLKVDLSVVQKTDFFDSVMRRKVPVEFGEGAPSFVTVTAEDIILMKLLWRKDSQSEKQWRDALIVVRVRGAGMDWKYLFGQARSLGIEADLIRLRDEAGI
jgi:hypothetical protein